MMQVPGIQWGTRKTGLYTLVGETERKQGKQDVNKFIMTHSTKM